MSFLKGIFGKDDKKQTPVAQPQPTVAGKSAPPARPFPPSLAQSPSQQQQQQSPQQSHLQQHHQQPTMVAMPPAPASNGGGDMFDLFDGLSLKGATPTHAATTAPPPTQAPLANGHPTSASAVTAGPADDDMFSGLTVASADPAVGIEPSTNANGGGSSLLNMLNEDGPSRKQSTAEPSGFSFVSETNADSTTAEGEPESNEGGGSSFSFMSSDTSAPQEEPQPVSTPITSSYQAPISNERKPSITTSNVPSPAGSSSPYRKASDAFNTPPHNIPPSSNRSSFSSPAGTGLSASTPKNKLGITNAAPTFEQIHNAIDSSLTSYWDNLKNLNLTQSAMRTQQITLQSSLKSAQDEILSLEAQQQHEIEQENYEGADQINSQLEDLKLKLAKMSTDLTHLTSHIDDQEANKTNLRRLTREVLEDALKQYQSLTKQYTFTMHQRVTEETQALEMKEDILITNLEKTRRNLTHTKQDLEKIDEEEKKITEQMKSDTREMTAEHDVLKSQLSGLEAERDELRALLEAKEAEVAMCSQKIDVVITNINSKCASHEKRLTRAQEKKMRMKQEQQEQQTEEEKLLHEKQTLEADFQRVAAQEKGSTRKLKKMQEEVAYIQGFVTHKLVTPTAHVPSGEGEQTSSPSSAASSSTAAVNAELSGLQQQLASTISQLESTRVSLTQLESSIDSQVKSLDQLNSRIPALEAEKNLAVATRDFKKAAQASKDVKALQTQKQELETALGELRVQGSTLNATLVNLTESKTNLSAQIVALESEADKKRLIGFLKARLELSWKANQVELLLKRNEQEKNEEQAAVATGQGAGSSLLAATSTSHHFSFLPHERAAYSVEEELLTKEVTQLRLRHQWSDTYLEDEARAELSAERKMRGEPPLEEAHAHHEPTATEEESSISEQRRKDRNAAIAAAAAAAAAENGEGTVVEMVPVAAAAAVESSPTSVGGDHTRTESTTEPLASPTSSVESVMGSTSTSGPSSPTASEPLELPADSPTNSEPAAAPVVELEPIVAPEVPAGPSEATIAEWRQQHDELKNLINTLEGQLQGAVEGEDFEEADRLETELVAKRQEQGAIEQQAKTAGIELSAPAAAN